MVFGFSRSVRNMRLPLRVDACPLYHDSGIHILEDDVVAREPAHHDVAGRLREQIPALAAEGGEDLYLVRARRHDYVIGAADIGRRTDQRPGFVEDIQRSGLEGNAARVANHARDAHTLAQREIERAAGVAETYPIRVDPETFSGPELIDEVGARRRDDLHDVVLRTRRHLV